MILDLYLSVKSGFSQCHHTGAKAACSGGWYFEMCPHGVTTGSKFLYRSESVRDAIDIKLSKEFVSPTNFLYTPCTAASHLIQRDPETAKNWFNERKSATWEEPKRNIPPSVKSFPKLAPELHSEKSRPLPSKTAMKVHQHPKTMDSDKFFCGDRFHEKKYPHKSELCRYHDVNLVPELKGVPTSGQENLNSIRNRTRLRTTCTQKLETHMFYNTTMDRAHNREVVRKQARLLGKSMYSRDPDWKFVV